MYAALRWTSVGAVALSVLLPFGAAGRAQAAPGAPAAYGGQTGRRTLDRGWFVQLDARASGIGRGYPAGHFQGQPVQLPYSPNARQVSSAASYAGSVAWYRTDLSVAAAGDYAVRFESVNHRARVWIDGREVARHTGDYLPFEVRRRLGAGHHRLVVRADWRSPDRMKREGWFRSWFNFGGINREVTVRRLGRTELDAPDVQTRLVAGKPVVTIGIRVRNRAQTRAITVSGRLGDTPLEFRSMRLGPMREAWVHATVRLGPSVLWSPSHPTLQTLRLAVAGESGYVARVGLRELRWRGEALFLNGRRLQLHGAAIQEDAPGHGDALTGADMDAMVTRLRAIGANATRAQHGLSPALLERLDAAGIFVWQEVGPFDVPGRWAARTPAARRTALRRVRLDVLAARAHPSVLIWNLANEIAGNGNPVGQRGHVERAARLVRALDPGRPVGVDVWGTHLPHRAGRIYRSLDVVGATNYEGWYADLHAPAAKLTRATRSWLTRLHALFPAKVLVVTEFGAEANRLNPSDAPGGVGFQSALLARHIRLYQADPHLSGMLAWSLQDFALRPDFLGGSVRSQDRAIQLQPGINAKGLFTYDGRPKPAAAVVKRLYGR